MQPPREEGVDGAVATPREELVEELITGLFSLRLLRRDLQRHAAFPLGSAGLTALGTLKRRETARVGDVAERLNVDVSVASRQVTALETAGFLVRERDPADGRSQLLRLTDAGRDALTAARARIAEMLSAAVAEWDDEELAALTAAIGRLYDDHRAAAEKEPRF